MKILQSDFPIARSEKDIWVTAKLGSPLGTAILAISIVMVSYLSGWTAERFLLSRQVVSAIYTGNALLVAVLLLVSRRTWPLLIAADVLGAALHGLHVGLKPRVLVLIITGATIGNLIAALGLQYCFNGVPRLNTLKGFSKYLLVAVVLAPLVASLVGAAAVQDFYWTNWRMWYFSEALAFLTITPAILGCVSIRPVRTSELFPFLAEFALLLGSVVLLSSLVAFVRWNTNPAALLFCFVPFLLWAAFRFGSFGVSCSIVVIAFLSIWGNVHGRGPFVVSDPFQSVQSLQLFLLSAAIPFMVLAALVEEREGTHQTLRTLSHKLIAAHEQERSRIARELHDDVCQRLALLSLKIEKAAKHDGYGQVSVAELWEQIRQQCSSLGNDVQAISHELHPSILDHVGLTTAVKSYCREVAQQNGVVVELSDSPLSGSLPKDVSLSVFRVVQEALRNAVKYSGQKQIKVCLQENSGQLELEVSDQGVGFDVSDKRNSGGLGLVSMAERISQVNGTFSIDSQLNVGTRIRARVPLAAKAKAMTNAVI